MKNLTAFLMTLTLALSTGAQAALIGPITQESTDTPKKEKATVGRYLYVGTAPKFTGDEIELTVSKMSLTLRATGWISQAKIDGYGSHLYRRWEKLDKTLQAPKFILHPLVSLKSVPTRDTSIAWTKIAGQYSSHVLENQGVEVFNAKRNAQSLEEAGYADEYRARISTAVLRYLFNNTSLTTEAVKADNQLRDSLISVTNSRRLFQAHHRSNYSASSAKTGFVGNITYVYPIAATVEGPFDQPKEEIRKLMSYGTIEARWWSDKWDDEFGGLPFILIEPSGVAFHGPITNFAPLDVWYLRRGYVSHGCHRMDTSDIIELRNILPLKLKDLGKVKLTILDNFDVTDWNNDGKKEVVDVKYYHIPTSVTLARGKTIEEVIKPYLIENQMKSYFANHQYAKSFYDVKTDTIKGAVKYSTASGVLKKEGVHGILPIYRFDYPASRILQYKELGTQMVPYDDTKGEFPPTYFLNN
jgi:hypothetical protein